MGAQARSGGLEVRGGGVVKPTHARAQRVQTFDIGGMQELGSAAAAAGGETPDLAALDPEALRAAVLAEAREEAARRIQEAYQEGFRRGVAAGEEAFAAQVGQSAEALARIVEAVGEKREAYLDAIGLQVIELTRLVAERVVQREWRSDPDLVLRTVRAALARITDRQRLTVRVHPEELDVLRARQATLVDEFPHLGELLFCADETIARGGCVADSDLMHADARLDTLLARVLEALDG